MKILSVDFNKSRTTIYLFRNLKKIFSIIYIRGKVFFL